MSANISVSIAESRAQRLADLPELLTTQHMLALLGVSNKTLTAWERERLIPPSVPGMRRKRWRKGSVLAWLS